MIKTFTSKIVLTLFVLVMFSVNVMGQTSTPINRVYDYQMQAAQPNANYYTIVTAKRAEFANLDLSTKANYKAFKQFERWAYIWKDRINPDGTFPASAQVIPTAQLLQILGTSNASSATPESGGCGTSTWTQIGPVNNPLQNGYAAYPGKGRINVVARDPNNSSIIYAGSAAGGIWKSTNGGTTWNPMSDFLAGLGVTDILIDPTNTNIIYMATGDGDGSHISSLGLFKSTDAGVTWNPTGLTFALSQNEYIRDIAFAPGSVTKIFALTNTEIKVSTNSGATWTNSTVTYPFGSFNEQFVNIIFDPNDPNKVVVSDYWGALYFSTDGGTNFAMHAVFQGGNNKDITRLAATPNDNDFFYALTQNGTFKRFTFNFANTAADEVSATTISGFNAQGGYNQCITVSPTNKNNIMIGGVRGYKSTNQGTSFSVLLNPYDNPPGVGFYVHPDHHFMAFNATGDTIINGHDGGVHIGSFSSTTGWTDLSNGLIITQPYNIGITQAPNGDNFMMANQDNDGFSKVLVTGTSQWVSAVAGDGTATGIDISNSDIRYLGGTKGALYKTLDGYASGYASSVTILSNDNDAAFVSPLELHPTVAPTIYAGHNDVKKSIDRGDNWTNLNAGLTGTNFLNVTTNGSSIRIYAIGSGVAKRSDNDGGSWSTVTPPSGTIINSFAAKENTTTVYATVGGYSAGNKVYMSTNNGSTWTNISSNLPNIVMKKILLKKSTSNDTLYLGTELGVYWKDAASTNWTKLGTTLPNVIITDLEFSYTDNVLFVGTFGRGMWKYPVLGGIDTEAPVADVASLPTINSACSVTSLTAPTATDNCAGAVTGTHATTLPITASTTVTWTYTDGSNTSTQTQSVVINDNVAPVADIASLPNVTAPCSVTALTAPTATDNCAGSVTGTHSATLPITSNTTVTWTYTDGSNTSTQTQNIVISNSATTVMNAAATNISSTSVDVTWDPMTLPTGGFFSVQYRVAPSGAWVSAGTAPAGTSMLSITGLTAGTNYEVQVRGNCDASNAWPWSASGFFTTNAGSCATAISMSATSNLGNSVTMGWTAVPSAAWYEFRYKVTGAPSWTNAGTLGGSATSKTFTGLMPSTSYDFQGRTFCPDGTASAWSTTVTEVTGPLSGCALAPNTVASTVTGASATITWTAVSGAGYYEFRYKPQASSTWISGGTAGPSATTKTYSGLAMNTTYDFEGRTFCSNGIPSAWGAITFTTTALAGCELPPALNSTAVSTSSTIQISWSAVSGAGWYSFQYKQSSASVWINGGTAGPSATAKTYSGLNAATSYDFQIRTHCPSGVASGWSASGVYSTSGIPAIVSNDQGNEKADEDMSDKALAVNNHVTTVYPNPSTDKVNVEIFMDEESKNTSIKLMDMSGRMVREIKMSTDAGLNTLTVDVQDLSNGLYTLLVYQNGQLLHTNKVKKN